MSFLSNLFRPKPQEHRAMINIDNGFQAFSGTAMNDPSFRTAVDAVARHCAKLTAHSDDNDLETLLNEKPNPYIGGYNLLFKTASAYLAANNAFILLERNGAGITAMYPITPSSVEFQAAPDNSLNLSCQFSDGKQQKYSYNDIVHVRRHFFKDLLGDDNAALYDLLDINYTLRQGITASVKNSTSLKGILKFVQLTNPEQQKKERDAFIRDYFNTSNNAGLATIDNRFDFVPANITPYTIPEKTIETVNAQICSYLGVSPRIVSGDYTENQFNSFYESVIEPFAIMLSQEFSRKTGANITFTSENLSFSSAQTKIRLIHEAGALGLLSINEARQLLSLPPVEGGDTRLQSLNVINAAKADQYQLESEVTEDEEKKPEN